MSLSLATQYEVYFLCFFYERVIFFSPNKNVSGQHLKEKWHLTCGNSGHCQVGNWVIGIIRMFTTLDPVVPLLEIYSSEIKALVEVKMFRRMFNAAFLVVEKKNPKD